MHTEISHHPTLSHPGSKSFLCPAYPHRVHYLPITHLIAISVIRSTVLALQCLCSGMISLNNGPIAQSSETKEAAKHKTRKDRLTLVPHGKAAGHTRKIIVHIGISAMCSFRLPLGVLKCYPPQTRGHCHLRFSRRKEPIREITILSLSDEIYYKKTRFCDCGG